MSEVIEIDSSDEEQQPDCRIQSSQESADSEPEITDQKVPLPAPNQILEIRRKRIDGIFAEYARHHNWLLNLEPLMNPIQLQRWQSHLDSRKKPIPLEPEEIQNLRETRETYMAEQLPDYLSDFQTPRPYQSRAPARYQRRRPVARRRKTKRRSAPKSAAVRKKTSTSRTVNYRSQTSATQGTSRPSTSGYSRTTVKSESKVRVKSEPSVRVKKER